jgi:hypothetical protein
MFSGSLKASAYLILKAFAYLIRGWWGRSESSCWRKTEVPKTHGLPTAPADALLSELSNSLNI